MSVSPKSGFELYVINAIREKRVALNMSQDDLAVILDTDRSFIGQVESPRNAAKYNLNHLNRISLEFKCSPRDFIPEQPITEKEIKRGKRK